MTLIQFFGLAMVMFFVTSLLMSVYRGFFRVEEVKTSVPIGFYVSHDGFSIIEVRKCERGMVVVADNRGVRTISTRVLFDRYQFLGGVA